MKSVLVTGANGFIGRHILAPLLEKNVAIHAIFSSGQPATEHEKITWHQINLHHAAAVDHLLQAIKPSHLLHLAWFAKPGEYWTSPINLQWLQSSIHLLQAFAKAGGNRAVCAGTSAEYDWQQGHCQEFLTPCKPDTLYGRTKYSLHLLSEILAQQNNLSLAWGRIFFLFGAHEYRERLIPAAIRHLRAKNIFTLMNGHQIRDFMYVKDIADALVTLLETDIIGPVNIASGQPIAIRDIIALIGQRLQAVDYIQDRHAMTRPTTKHDSVTADVARLHTEVKWQPQYSLETAIDETIAWWSKNP